MIKCFTALFIFFCTFQIWSQCNCEGSGELPESGGQPEFYFNVKDNPGANYRLYAEKYGNAPIYDKYYHITNNHNQVWGQTDEYCNPLSFPAEPYSFTQNKGFDLIRDLNGGGKCRGILGFGLYKIVFYRESNTSTVFEPIFSFYLDLRHTNWIWSPDLFFEFTYDNGNKFLNIKEEGELKRLVPENSTIRLWEELGFPKDWSNITKSPVISNDFSGSVNPSVTMYLDETNMGDPNNLYSSGDRFYTGDTPVFWKEALYTFSVAEQVNYNNQNYKVRNWNNLGIYGSVGTLSITDDNITPKYLPTLPLTVINNLEGGTGGNYKIAWDKKLNEKLTITSGSSYNAFNNNVVPDYYTLESFNQNVLNTNWSFLKWQDGTTSLQKLQQVTSPTTLTAFYKGNLRSNQADAFGSSGQRKIVRDNTGIYHAVYVSMNTLWYTKSVTTNFNGTWTNEVPLTYLGGVNEGETYKNPSLDIYNDEIIIVFEYAIPTDNEYHIMTGQISNSQLTTPEFVDRIDPACFGQSYPVAAKFSDESFFIYKKSLSEPLKFRRKYVGIWSDTVNNNLNNAAVSSKHPTVDKNISGTNVAMMAWQESNTIIKYQEKFNKGNNIQIQNYAVVSNGSGYTYNHSPSLVEFSGGSRIVWIGENNITVENGGASKENSIQNERRVVFKAPDYYRFWSFGNDVNAPSINKNDALNAYVFAWSESDGSYTNKFADNSLSTIRTMNTFGKEIQVARGTNDKSTMFGMSFDSRTLPYKFTPSNSFASFSKENALAFSSGRKGILYNDNASFYFLLGDIQKDGSPVKFIEFSDSAYIQTIDDLNMYLKTEPFTLNDNSPFSFNVQYGLIDSASAGLLDAGSIKYRVELVDNENGEVIGNFVNSSGGAGSLSFDINTGGIGSRTAFLRVVMEYNQESHFSVVDILSENDLLLKTNVKEVSFKGDAGVKDYALEQNYPNPFNPSTVINYAVPKDGYVTLKIYDVLGSEIKTLVSGYQTSGRYTVTFNADNLASGIYIYRLQSGDFVTSKKMSFIK